MAEFPRTTVGGVSLSRMIIGSNWIYGWSHTGAAADAGIKKRHERPEDIAAQLDVFLAAGVDTLMGPMCTANPVMYEAVKMSEEKAGRKIILVDTPVINVDDTKEGRAEAQRVIKSAKKGGATFCLIHHSSAEQLVSKNKHTMDRLPDYLCMIREEGMIPGLSAHMPELILYSDEQEYDVQTYIQLYNCMGFLMQIEIESVHKIIWNAKKPVMTIKPMAAGRCSPFVGITFSFSTIRDCDMVTVGCTSPLEAAEDIEIGMAALERRPPNLEGRSSPNKTAIIK